MQGRWTSRTAVQAAEPSERRGSQTGEQAADPAADPACLWGPPDGSESEGPSAWGRGSKRARGSLAFGSDDAAAGATWRCLSPTKSEGFVRNWRGSDFLPHSPR